MRPKEFIFSYDVVVAGIYSVIAKDEEEAFEKFHAVPETELIESADNGTAIIDNVQLSDGMEYVEKEEA